MRLSPKIVARLNPAGDCHRVAIIRSSYSFTEFLRPLCKSLGHEVDAAFDGVHGLELVQCLQPNIVLAGMELGGLDGVQLAREIRRTMPSPPLLIALTSYNVSEVREREIAELAVNPPRSAAAAESTMFDLVITIPCQLEDLLGAFRWAPPCQAKRPVVQK